MAQRRATPHPDTSSPQRSRPLSTDMAGLPQTSKEQSTMISMLPSMVQSRLPQLSALRRSVSIYGINGRGVGRLRPHSTPDEYNAMVLSRIRVGEDYTEVVRADAFEEVNSEEEDDQNTRRKQQRKSAGLTENQSGIGWKFAGQGLTLLSLAVTESRALSENPVTRTGSPSFARKLYIHALTYLINGLPTDLATEESLSIRAALPSGVISPLRVQVCGEECRRLCDSPVERSGRLRTSEPSVLHRTLAYTIIHIFIFVQFILPYIKVVLRAAYEYERTHHISQKFLAGSIDALDGLGRIGIKGSGAVWGSSLALGLGEVVNWVMDGVSGGIQEGLGEGMARVGIRKEIEEE